MSLGGFDDTKSDSSNFRANQRLNTYGESGEILELVLVTRFDQGFASHVARHHIAE